MGLARTGMRARQARPSDSALHGPFQPRAAEKLPRHDSVQLRLQVIYTSHAAAAAMTAQSSAIVSLNIPRL